MVRMRSATFKCYDPADSARWCEIKATVREIPPRDGIDKLYSITYDARYSGRAADCAHVHPLSSKPWADTDGVIVPAIPTTTDLLNVLLAKDEAIIESAGRQLALLPRTPKEERERAASARRAAAIRALAEIGN